jgi:hypothetical protein
MLHLLKKCEIGGRAAFRARGKWLCFLNPNLGHPLAILVKRTPDSGNGNKFTAAESDLLRILAVFRL